VTITEGSITDVVVATTAQDAAAAQAVRQHHAELADALAVRVEALLATAAAGGEPFEDARRLAFGFLAGELVPHAAAEEVALYPAAAASAAARLLIDGMLAEHKVILSLVDQLTAAGDPVRAAATGYALQVLFQAHLTKENDLVLPVVAADPAVSLAEILAGIHELLGQDGSPLSGPHSHGHDHGRCGCGESDSGTPELDVRAIPHAIRHATVFGAFDAIPPGGSMVLIASHDPQPLLRQLAVRTDGRLDVAYLERGPEVWRLQLTRL
jgi:uncharacterized protein (DUF2249 family)